MKFITVKDEEGILRPLVGIWPQDHTTKFHQPDIDKFLKKVKGTLKLVEVEITEIRELNNK